MVDAKNASKCTDLHVTIQKFPGGAEAMNPYVGEGLQHPSPNPIPSALRRCTPPSGPQWSPMFVSPWRYWVCVCEITSLCVQRLGFVFTLVNPLKPSVIRRLLFECSMPCRPNVPFSISNIRTLWWFGHSGAYGWAPECPKAEVEKGIG